MAYGLSVRQSGMIEMLAGLRRKAAAVAPGNRKALFAAAGRYMVNTEEPLIFREHAGWPPPKSRSGDPLLDTGHLRDSISYLGTGDNLIVGSTSKYARIHQRGGTVTPGPGKKFLVRPLSPPLTVSERRSMRPRDFPGAFPLLHGPEGPGIYRRAKGAVIAHNRFSGGASKYSRARRLVGAVRIERIFAFMRSAKIPKREFLKWTQRALSAIGRLWAGMTRKAA